MKKIKILSAILLFLTVILCSCKNSENITDDNSILSTPKAVEYKIDNEIVITPEKTEYSQDVTIIEFQIYNYHNDWKSESVDGYILEIKKDDGWYPIKYKKDLNREIISLAVELDPLKPWKSELDLSELYDLPLAKGIYRIGNESYINIGYGSASLEFEIV